MYHIICYNNLHQDFSIKESTHEKLLGMWVDNNLSWTTQITNLERKLRHRLFNLRRLSEHIPTSLLKTVADGIFMSILRYGLPVFCPVRIREEEPKHNSIDKIRVVFNDCLRLLTNHKRKEHVKIEDMLTQLGWLSINQLCAETRLIEAWKSEHLENYCIGDMLIRKEKSSHMKTRSNNQTTFKSGQHDKFTNGSFMQRTAEIWNQAPKGVKEATELPQAKRAIRTFVKTLPI